MFRCARYGAHRGVIREIAVVHQGLVQAHERMGAARMPDPPLGGVAVVADPDVCPEALQPVRPDGVVAVAHHLEDEEILPVREHEGALLAERAVPGPVEPEAVLVHQLVLERLLGDVGRADLCGEGLSRRRAARGRSTPPPAAGGPATPGGRRPGTSRSGPPGTWGGCARTPPPVGRRRPGTPPPGDSRRARWPASRRTLPGPDRPAPPRRPCRSPGFASGGGPGGDGDPGSASAHAIPITPQPPSASAFRAAGCGASSGSECRARRDDPLGDLSRRHAAAPRGPGRYSSRSVRPRSARTLGRPRRRRISRNRAAKAA